MNYLSRPSSAKNDKYSELVYGTDNGIIGSLKANQSGMRPGWQLPADRKGLVNCIETYDLTHNGVADILVISAHAMFTSLCTYSHAYVLMS